MEPAYGSAARSGRQALLDAVLADLTQGRRVAYDRELRKRGARGAAAARAPPQRAAIRPVREGRRPRARPARALTRRGLRRAAGRAPPPGVPVPLAQAAGALALLVESGSDAEGALTIARDLLEGPSPRLRGAAARDARLAAALARAELARDAAARREPSRACAELRAAAAELAAAGAPPLAPALAADCAAALASLLPAAVAEQLEAPLSAEAAPRRAAALSALAPLLADAASPLSADDVAQRLLPALTAAEAAGLLDWSEVARAGSAAHRRWAPLLRAGVRALLAVARAARDPRAARAAAAAAQRAAAAAGRDAAAAADWAPERAVACVLLGEPDAALALLEEAARAGGGAGGAPIAAVRAAAGGPDLLAGLVTWTEGFLADEALGAFRDTAGADARLAAYFEARGGTACAQQLVAPS